MMRLLVANLAASNQKRWSNDNVICRRIGRNSQRGGGAFFETGNNSKRTWPKFSSALNQIEAVFLSKSGDLQKKKVFTVIQSVFLTNFGWDPEKKNSTFLVKSPSQLLLPNSIGGLFSFLEQKSALKALKTWYFAYFSGQWGALAPPGSATSDLEQIRPF